MTVAQQYIDAVNRADIDALMGLFARDGIIERLDIYYRQGARALLLESDPNVFDLLKLS